MTVDKVLTLKEAAAFLKIPQQTMYKLAQEGKVPGKKVGKQWRFHADVLEKWLKGEKE
ncbi:hypothetical protein GCM10011571_33700 [Marinithermofilum abyssi]|uniref:Helix-turn-helix domain-containing protein n=1 Tax=Marinithermofilum abyssi TaxID=1571185 RepID=A0A8J2VLW8_9BACL|nr:helix-turn-helix domain-containing protein [Marinithermofilum abyssi]GGE28822.1 hypothetical protein GCM10011571_33700 [Marinithermofilum abyssi]